MAVERNSGPGHKRGDSQDDQALREQISDAISDPWNVACDYCGAEQWTACAQHDPCHDRRTDAVLAVLSSQPGGDS